MKKASAPGNLYVGDFHIAGTIVFAGKRKAQRQMLREGDLFIPTRKAIIHVMDDPEMRLPATVAMINNKALIAYQYDEAALESTE